MLSFQLVYIFFDQFRVGSIFYVNAKFCVAFQTLAIAFDTHFEEKYFIFIVTEFLLAFSLPKNLKTNPNIVHLPVEFD